MCRPDRGGARRSVRRFRCWLTEFSIQAVTQGIDALAEVTIRIRQGNDIYTGRAAHTDICVASARAYMHALNRLLDRVTHAAQPRVLENV